MQRVVLEVPKRISGADTGHVFRDYPKDNEHRDVMVGAELCRAIRALSRLAAQEYAKTTAEE